MAAPLIDYSLASTWAELYDLDAEPYAITGFRPHVRLGYHRSVLMRLSRDQAQAYIDKLGWLPTQKIALIGCGFGWTAEVLINEHGFSPTRLIGCDTSSYIQANKSLTESADIDAAITAVGLSPTTGEGLTVKGKLHDGGTRSRVVTVANQSGGTVSSRNAIKLALGGGTLDKVLTEGVLESLVDKDCQSLSTSLHSLATVVQHLIVPLGPGNFITANWKSLEDWKILLPSDTFLEAGTYRVL